VIALVVTSQAPRIVAGVYGAAVVVRRSEAPRLGSRDRPDQTSISTFSRIEWLAGNVAVMLTNATPFAVPIAHTNSSMNS
jgi:hypothetical protein